MNSLFKMVLVVFIITSVMCLTLAYCSGLWNIGFGISHICFIALIILITMTWFVFYKFCRSEKTHKLIRWLSVIVLTLFFWQVERVLIVHAFIDGMERAMLRAAPFKQWVELKDDMSVAGYKSDHLRAILPQFVRNVYPNYYPYVSIYSNTVVGGHYILISWRSGDNLGVQIGASGDEPSDVLLRNPLGSDVSIIIFGS